MAKPKSKQARAAKSAKVPKAPAAPAGLDATIRLETSAAALSPRLDGLLRDRREAVRQRSLDALRTMAVSAAGTLALVGAAYLLYRWSLRVEGDWDELIQVGAGLVALVALAPGFVFFAEIPALLGFDPHGGYLNSVVAWLRQLAPDLHPDAPVRLTLYLGDVESCPTYRTGTSPYSGAHKAWYRVERLALAVVLADGSRVALRASEKRKTKASSTLYTEGQVRLRLELAGAGRPPAEASGWSVAASTSGPRPAWLLWRKGTSFDERLPDLGALIAAWRPVPTTAVP